MIWILGILGFTALYMIVKMAQSSTPRGFAKEVAKAQLLSLYAFRNKYAGTPAEQLYSQALMTRPGYHGELAAALVSEARLAALTEGAQLRFWLVVLQLVSYEYTARTGLSPLSVMHELREGVLSVVPADL